MKKVFLTTWTMCLFFAFLSVSGCGSNGDDGIGANNSNNSVPAYAYFVGQTITVGGAPLSGVAIDIKDPLAKNGGTLASVILDSSGNFFCSVQLPSGQNTLTIELSAAKSGYETYIIDLTVQKGFQVNRIITLAGVGSSSAPGPGNVHFSGIVKDESSAVPIGSANVLLSCAGVIIYNDTTDAGGNFQDTGTIGVGETVSCSLQVDKPGYYGVVESVQLAPDATLALPVTLTLIPTYTAIFSGTVEKGGSPLGFAQIEVLWGTSNEPVTEMADASGNFNFTATVINLDVTFSVYDSNHDLVYTQDMTIVDGGSYVVNVSVP